MRQRRTRLGRSGAALAACLVYVLALQLIASATVALADVQAGALKIGQPWSRATPNGAQVGAGYLTITNTGPEPDRLVGGSLANAGRVEVHAVTMENGVMRMHPVEGGLEIKPGETVVLKPGGNHMMFMDLTAPLREGETVEGTLIFEKAGTVRIPFTVEGVAARAPAAGAHGRRP
jgi:periplasmic copper chaperone A